MSVNCPECGDGFDDVHGVNIHWGVKHEGDCPIEYEDGDHPADGFEHSDEFVARMRDRDITWNDKISNALTGHEHTEETIEKIREGNMGKEISDEARQLISEAHSGENHWNWQGGDHTTRGYEWNSVASDVRERDNHRCQFCGLPAHLQPSLHVHHVIPIRHGGEDDHGNLLSLCVRCHALAERRRLGVPSSSSHPVPQTVP